jgi:aldose 1-epimerase
VTSHPRSGEQHEIRFADQVAVATEVGATLRSYTVGGVEVVDGFAVDETSSAGRGQVLAPWPNRLDGGRYAFEGVEGRAPIDEPERGNAIHGLVRWFPWSVSSASRDAVALTCVLQPRPAYPWRLELTVEYRLGASGLTVGADVRNRSEGRAPFGLGFHPYLTVGVPIDEARLRLEAVRRLITDERGLPVGATEVDSTDFDFRTGRTIGSTKLDTCYTDLAIGPDGRWRVRLERDAGDRSVELWAEEAFGYLMAFTGDTVEPESRRRRSIAIEPMTCPANAFATGTDVIALAPGATWRGSWGIVPASPPG